MWTFSVAVTVGIIVSVLFYSNPYWAIKWKQRKRCRLNCISDNIATQNKPQPKYSHYSMSHHTMSPIARIIVTPNNTQKNDQMVLWFQKIYYSLSIIVGCFVNSGSLVSRDNSLCPLPYLIECGIMYRFYYFLQIHK